MGLIESSSKRTIFETSDDVSTHAEFQIQTLEVDETSQLVFHCFFNCFYHLLVLVFLKILCKHRAVDTHERGVGGDFKNANVLQVFFVDAALYKH